MLTIDDYPAFYHELHGKYPEPWNKNYLQTLLNQERIDSIILPPNIGKNSLIDAHIFANAITGYTPLNTSVERKIVFVLREDAPFSDAFLYAQKVCEKICEPNTPLLDVVYQGLKNRAGTDFMLDTGDVYLPELLVSSISMTSCTNPQWRYYPTSVQVLCISHEVLAAQLLMGSFYAHRFDRNIEAGILAFDTLMVVDDVDVCSQLLYTLHEIRSQIIQRKNNLPLPVPPLRTLRVKHFHNTWTHTAPHFKEIPDNTLNTLANDWDDAAFKYADKPLKLTSNLTQSSTIQAVNTMAKELNDLREAVKKQDFNHYILAIASTPDLAVEVYKKLTKHCLPTSILLLIGKPRPADMNRIIDQYPGLFNNNGEKDIDYVITTPFVEASLGFTPHAIVTMLAPGALLAQRFALANPTGEPISTPIIVTPHPEKTYPLMERRGGKYNFDDTINWLQSLNNQANPHTLITHEPPALPTRTFYQTLESEIYVWSMTSQTYFGEHNFRIFEQEIDIFNEESEYEIGIVLRHIPQEILDQHEKIIDPSILVDVWKTAGIGSDEVFPVKTHIFMQSLEEIHTYCQKYMEDDATFPILCFQPEGEEKPFLSQDMKYLELKITTRPTSSKIENKYVLYDVDENNIHTPQPGEIYILPEGIPVFIHSVYAGKTLFYADKGGIEIKPERLQTNNQWAGLNDISFRANKNDLHQTRSSKKNILHWGITTYYDGDWSDEYSSEELLAKRVGLTDGFIAEKIRCADHDNLLAWSSRQKKTTVSQFYRADNSPDPVPLKDFQANAQKASEHVTRTLGFTPDDPVTVTLILACEHGFDGMKVPMLQNLMLDTGEENQPKFNYHAITEYLAKKSRHQKLSLPYMLNYFTFEQASIGYAYNTVIKQAAQPELLTRLIGTSHGKGRSSFPTIWNQFKDFLYIDDESTQRMNELFNEGEWETIIEKTDWNLTPWACAYLETITRATYRILTNAGF